ncbi:hypothetical protein B0H67DRAFT_253644 [Lasiosphaeris hirsuta]|uniref:Uncharacterized protein n=1 Tax=Lasiosphaeris hirsuta TaxID=260670 RepID=A0AA40DW80_9PEZI|nr:hypothetical protein B0H67DRAFT_253644 [Lasiosphaeris hirsuta]
MRHEMAFEARKRSRGCTSNLNRRPIARQEKRLDEGARDASGLPGPQDDRELARQSAAPEPLFPLPLPLPHHPWTSILGIRGSAYHRARNGSTTIYYRLDMDTQDHHSEPIAEPHATMAMGLLPSPNPDDTGDARLCAHPARLQHAAQARSAIQVGTDYWMCDTGPGHRRRRSGLAFPAARCASLKIANWQESILANFSPYFCLSIPQETFCPRLAVGHMQVRVTSVRCQVREDDDGGGRCSPTRLRQQPYMHSTQC